MRSALITTFSRSKRGTGLIDIHAILSKMKKQRGKRPGREILERGLPAPSSLTSPLIHTPMESETIPFKKREQTSINEAIRKRLLFSTPFRITLKDYHNLLNEEEREELHIRVYEENWDWIQAELDRRGAEWMIVVGEDRRVIDSSPNIQTYPEDEQIEAIAKMYDRVPFLFVRSSKIEEYKGSSSWVEISYNDFYPTIPVFVGHKDWRKKRLRDSGQSLDADFDTGSPYTYFSYEWLNTNGFVSKGKWDRPHLDRHLEKDYWFYILCVGIGILKRKRWIFGGIHMGSKPFRCRCVIKWDSSPFRIRNPKRLALVGIDLITEFLLEVRLNGAKKLTTITWFS